jgi:hypothetical protein
VRARILLGAFVSLTVIGLMVAPSVATPGGTFKAALTGYEEVPAVSTDASGTFRAKVDPAGPTIEYELSYSNIQNAFAAHIHFGQTAVNGGVSAFLCGGGDKPPCPATGGTVSGSIDAADIVGPASQGIAPGEIEELIDAMIADVTYANVHTNDGVAPPNTGPGDFPGGEIRGQIS